jgi:hypothetical protein
VWHRQGIVIEVVDRHRKWDAAVLFYLRDYYLIVATSGMGLGVPKLNASSSIVVLGFRVNKPAAHRLQPV